MAENYNLNSTFGLNVSKNGSFVNPQKAKQVNLPNIENLFDTATSYIKKYEDVFDGSVEKEINMYSRQAMIVGMNLKAADTTRRKFDMNI